MGNFKRRVKDYEKRLDIGGAVDVIHVPPPPPAINAAAIESFETFPRRPGETDQEYLDRYNDPGPGGWRYDIDVRDHGKIKICWPVRSREVCES